MDQLPITTYRDLLDHLIDFMGANVSGEADRDSKRAVQAALREFSNAHRWSFYYQRGRVTTVPMYNSGTIQYTNATRTLTLTTTDGTSWPSWITQGLVLLNASFVQQTGGTLTGTQNIEYPVASQTDSFNIVLPANNNPGADIPAGSTYMAYQDTYACPADLISCDEIINATYVLGLEYVHPSLWLARHRLIYTPSTPYRYTITGHPQQMGLMAFRFFPAPDIQYQMDYIYQRRARSLVTANYSTGTASASINGVAVTGTGASWNANHLGSVIRFGADGKTAPTSLIGSNPYLYERVITAVNSATSLTIDQQLPASLTNVLYTISDPVDVEEGTMMTAFLRCCEFQLARSRNMKDRGEIQGQYQNALMKAKDADSRSFQPRAAGVHPATRLRLAYMPRGPDIG